LTILFEKGERRTESERLSDGKGKKQKGRKAEKPHPLRAAKDGPPQFKG
jgi:hypothetical protein